MTAIGLEAHNFQYKIAEFIDDFACVYVYHGSLDLTDDDQWIVLPGDQWIIEVYDRATTSIWFELDDDGFRRLGDIITGLTGKEPNHGR